MEIRMRETDATGVAGQVVTDSEFRAMFPNTGFPVQLTEQIINDFGGDVVFEGPQASGDHYQFSMRQGIENINGKWYTKYVLGPIFEDYTKEDGTVITAAEQETAYKAQKDAEQAESIRKQRNSLLADWVDRMNPIVWEVMTDEQKQGWRDYRQALLDVTSQEGFPWTVVWPDTPTELAKKN